MSETAQCNKIILNVCFHSGLGLIHSEYVIIQENPLTIEI